MESMEELEKKIKKCNKMINLLINYQVKSFSKLFVNNIYPNCFFLIEDLRVYKYITVLQKRLY